MDLKKLPSNGRERGLLREPCQSRERAGTERDVLRPRAGIVDATEDSSRSFAFI